MERKRDERGWFISTTAQALLEQSNQLAAKVEELIEKENEAPT